MEPENVIHLITVFDIFGPRWLDEETITYNVNVKICLLALSPEVANLLYF